MLIVAMMGQTVETNCIKYHFNKILNVHYEEYVGGKGGKI